MGGATRAHRGRRRASRGLHVRAQDRRRRDQPDVSGRRVDRSDDARQRNRRRERHAECPHDSRDPAPFARRRPSAADGNSRRSLHAVQRVRADQRRVHRARRGSVLKSAQRGRRCRAPSRSASCAVVSAAVFRLRDGPSERRAACRSPQRSSCSSSSPRGEFPSRHTIGDAPSSRTRTRGRPRSNTKVRGSLDFAIDGGVVKVNALALWPDLGIVGGREPRYAIARKFAPDIGVRARAAARRSRSP